MSPDICEHPQMCWDAAGQFVFSGGAAGGVAIVPNSDTDPMLLLEILNSKMADGLIRAFGTPYRGGCLNCEIRFIRDLPIKVPESSDEKKLADRISAAVRAIIDAKLNLRAPRPSGHQEPLSVTRASGAGSRLPAFETSLFTR
jgi:hypothetical protein